MEVLSHVSAKKITETLKGFKFRIFVGHFQADSNGTGRAVKGLSTRAVSYTHLTLPTKTLV